jgi:hypothetical protein
MKNILEDDGDVFPGCVYELISPQIQFKEINGEFKLVGIFMYG